jgi:serine/threonine-protein kinase RsbT
MLACEKGRALAAQAGLSSNDQIGVVIAVSEMGHNIIAHAGHGEIILSLVQRDGRRGVVIVASDEGPGIPDVGRALLDGYSTSGGLGMGLPGARRLMDEFEISSQVGKGTTVVMKKWQH